MQITIQYQIYTVLSSTQLIKNLLFSKSVTKFISSDGLLGLTWDNVDLINGIVHINTVVSTGRTKLHVSEPKTPKSKRSVPVTPLTIAALKAHKIRLAEERLKADVWEDHNLVFPNQMGGYSAEHNIARRYFKPVLKAMGLPESIRIYDLRHSSATLLLAANIHTKIISERLGHSNPTLTLNTYMHVIPQMQEQVVQAMSTLLDTGAQAGAQQTTPNS